jgi:CheY-like chemotaxis protein
MPHSPREQPVLLRIIKRPPDTFDGIALDHYQVGGIYEVGSQMCGVLLLEGWAELATCEPGGPFLRRPPAIAAPVVLVVDDEPEIRRLTERALTAEGYRVQTAANGQEAIRRLKESPPDVILLDLNMPVMDGWQFCAAQRRLIDDRLAAIPVLLLTAAENARNEAAKLHAVGVLRKPFDFTVLLEAIRTAISSRDDQSPAY